MQTLEFGFPASETRLCRFTAGEGAMTLLVEDLASSLDRFASTFLISDSVVGPIHAEPLRRQLLAHGLVSELIQIPAGESHKSRETKAQLEDRLVELGAGRDCRLVAVGGGVVGDIAGFVAATWHRGVPVIQVPTTLLSMVDASLGGKTAVNIEGGKNLIGAFHQPSSIFADVKTLHTLPESIYREGLAEVVKSALVADRELFQWLENSAEGLIGRQPDILERTVVSCARIKGRIVTRDEREDGLRAVLNFGHTVAHAIESVAEYRISHGQAVSIGQCIEGRLAVEENGFPEEHLGRTRALLRRFGLPVAVPADLDIDRILQVAYRDKKVREGRLRCALPVQIGQMMPTGKITQEVSESRMRAALMNAVD